MKKLVFMFVAMAALTFAACGNKTTAEAPATDTVPTDTTPAVVDTNNVDSPAVAAETPAPAEEAAAPAEEAKEDTTTK